MTVHGLLDFAEAALPVTAALSLWVLGVLYVLSVLD